MRVVLLLDRPFARRERALIARLEIGLADEGIRVIHAVPRQMIESESVGLYSRAVGYDDAGFPLPRRVRVRNLLEALRQADDDQDPQGEPIGIIHAFAPSVWRLGVDAAAALNCAAALEVWSIAGVPAAAELSRLPAHPRLLVADGAVFDALAHRTGRARGGGSDRIMLTPWGVHGEPRERTPAEAVGIVMLVDAVHPPAFDAALTGLAAACRRDPRLIVFINAGRAASHAVWRRLRRLGIADRTSLITDAEARRDAVLRLDALVLAEPSGRIRSIALDAMARGVPVIAAADPGVSHLINGVTARLVGGMDAAEWERAIVGIGEPAASGLTELGARASAWVRENRSASAHVQSVLHAYEVITRAAITRPAA